METTGQGTGTGTGTGTAQLETLVNEKTGEVVGGGHPQGWIPVTPEAAQGNGSPPPVPTQVSAVVHEPTPEEIRLAATQGALTAHAAMDRKLPSVRWLRVDLAPIERAGFHVYVRLSLSDVMVKAIHLDKPETFYWLFGEHNLTYPDDQPDLYSPFETDPQSGEPVLLSPAHAAGDPLPKGGTQEFVRELDQDIVRYAFGQAMVVIVRGGRTETEKKV